MKKSIIILAGLMAAVACGQGSNSPQPVTRAFPKPASVPSVYQTVEEKVEYVTEHYWDGFFAVDPSTVACDSSHILGVSTENMEAAVANFLGVLSQASMPVAQKGVRHLFEKMEQIQKLDTLNSQFSVFSTLLSRYMYDVNSPLRNEDYYLPLVSALAESRFTPDSLRPVYRHDARMCSMNQYGSVVPDFKFLSLSGRTYSLHAIDADYIMLFFSNPGCHACKGIIDEVMSRPYIEDYIAGGILAVVNVYIDEDVAAWKEYAHNYPASWYSGYDPKLVIRSDRLYNVRAIPSLYLLDSEKRVIMKDAVTENVLSFLDNIQNQ